MLYFHVTGGLGNQMFIYAVARSIALKNNTDFSLDISTFETYKRPFLLNKFNILENYADIDKVNKFIKLSEKKSFLGLLEKIKPFSMKSIWEEKDYYKYKSAVMDVPQSRDVMLKGFWQNEKYFINIRDVLLKEFTLKDGFEIKNQNLINNINNTNSVSLHIRRTDSLIKTYFGVMPINFYEEAINVIADKHDNLNLFVFSDDIKWCKENIKFNYPTTFVSDNEGLEDYQELVAMSQCRHNIIANSTFSWWSAWLNSNPNKIVIAPKIWFADGRSNRGLIPDTWLEI